MIRRGSLNATRHSKRLPLRSHTDLTTITFAKWEPIPLLVLCLQQISQSNPQESKRWVVQQITVIDNFDRDDAGVFIGNQEFRGGFPDGRDGMLVSRSLVDCLAPDENFGEGVEILIEGLGCVELFGLVQRESYDSDLYNDAKRYGQSMFGMVD